MGISPVNYLLGIPLSLHLVYIAMFGVAFLYSGSLWSFLTVGGVVSLACQGFLAREACVGVVMGGAGFLLSGVQECKVMSFEMSVGLV